MKQSPQTILDTCSTRHTLYMMLGPRWNGEMFIYSYFISISEKGTRNKIVFRFYEPSRHD